MSDQKLTDTDDPDVALSELLRMGYVWADENDGNEAVTISVNANDIFGWACADAEPLPYSEIVNLHRLVRTKPWGQIRWLCKRRNMKPQRPVEDDMKKVGVWDAEMEALPENPAADL